MAFQAAATEPTTLAPVAMGTAQLSFDVYSSLAAAEPVWRELETRAISTPYQKFDWINAYCRAGFDVPDTIAIVVLKDQGKAIALMPFGVSRQFGVRQARIIGMPISNSDALVYDPRYAPKLTVDALKAAFAALNHAGAGADIISFHSMLAEWQGHANPLMAFPHAPAPNNLYLTKFEFGPSSFIEQALPHKRRTNIRRSQRRLAETLGETSVRMARSAEEVERFHAAFLEQRAKRFERMGVENIFATAPFQKLFKTLALEALGEPSPTFRYHALFAGDEVLATSLGVTTATHYSQYINSTTDGPAAKYSLMGVMMSALVDELRAEGVISLDMGLGDFDYKADWTSATTVYDSVIPVSALGATAAPVLLAARKLKRTIKQNPALWSAARRVLAFRTRLRRGGDNHSN